jgi:hypothetical protein
MAADVLTGHDRDCASWIRLFRPAEGADANGRRGGRRRRGGE